MVGKPVNPKCGLLVECVGNRHDDTVVVVVVVVVLYVAASTYSRRKYSS